MSTLLERSRRIAGDGHAPMTPRSARTRKSGQPTGTRQRRGGTPLAGVPLWTGRILQIIAVTMVLVAATDVVLPDGIYWATSYFAVFGFSPEPVVFNAVLLFVVGAASKRRLRGALAFLVVYEIPTVLLPFTNLLDAFREGSVLPGDIQRVDVVAALVAAGLIVLLLAARKQYSAVLERGTYGRAAAVFVGGVVAAVITGGLLARLMSGPDETVADSWWWALYSATGVYPSSALVDVGAAGLHQNIETLVSSISAVSLLVALSMLLRSARARRLVSADEELELRRILAANRTDDALAYFSTRRDKSVVFSPSRHAVVSYRVVGAIALASGDPIGPEEEWDAAITEWLRVVDHFGWRPAVLAASERAAHHYQRCGMRGMVLGDEAVLHLSGPHAEAVKRSPQVASARRRARRAGYTAQFRRQRDIPHAELVGLADLAEDWRHGADERGFSMALSRFADSSDGDALVATAHDEDGRVMALLVFVPWNADGVSLDVMRRHPASINGATEFLVSELVKRAPALGLTRVSLNFAVLRDVFVRGARVGAGPLLRAKRRALLMVSRHWQLDSLRRANEKYDPEWRPRLVMWSRRTTIASVMLAVARAEGFTRAPRRLDIRTESRSAEFASAVRAIGAAAVAPLPVPSVSPSTARRIGIAEAIRASDGDPFPPRVARTAALSEVRRDIEEAGSTGPLETVSVTGRVLGRRRHGGITFLDVVEDHVPLQIIADAGRTREYGVLRRIDLGDLISVTGAPVRSAHGEPSIAADEWDLAAKSLRQPPNRRTGLRDPEAQVRQRQVHLATSPEAAELLRARARATRALREGLIAEDYLEVETPVLQRTHGGATARPFRTHINAYDTELTLRIAPELALKRLVVAGFPRVFEIGRNFRNEGVDATHNPEFTAMEAYRAFADYNDMRRLAERLIRSMLVAASGSMSMILPTGDRIDVSAPWRVISVCDALTECIGIPIRPDHHPDALRDVCAVYGVSTPEGATTGAMIEALYEELVESRTVQPTFFTDFPADTSPLARPHRRTPGLAERWDLVAGGMELGTAYTELNDPVEQRRRLTEQSMKAAQGDPEAMRLDEEFLAALEFGMPPTGGLGLGVDRIVMAATGATIRQTLAFPFVR